MNKRNFFDWRQTPQFSKLQDWSLPIRLFRAMCTTPVVKESYLFAEMLTVNCTILDNWGDTDFIKMKNLFFVFVIGERRVRFVFKFSTDNIINSRIIFKCEEDVTIFWNSNVFLFEFLIVIIIKTWNRKSDLTTSSWLSYRRLPRLWNNHLYGESIIALVSLIIVSFIQGPFNK